MSKTPPNTDAIDTSLEAQNRLLADAINAQRDSMGADAIFSAADAQIEQCTVSKALAALPDVLFSNTPDAQNKMGLRYNTVLFDDQGILRQDNTWAADYLRIQSSIEPSGDDVGLQNDVLRICERLIHENHDFAEAVCAQHTIDHKIDGRSQILEARLARADGVTWAQATGARADKSIV